MTASALAVECSLPLLFVQLHSLITKYLGETAAKLHLVFDAMGQTKGVYLFDEFDAIGSTRSARNDVGEIRRVLNSYLQFLEMDESESIVVAATNFVGMLDEALFRRFDDVIRYELPDAKMAMALVKNRLSSFDIEDMSWTSISRASQGLSHAEITRACDDAAKDAVLSDRKSVATGELEKALRVRRDMHPSGRARRKSAR
jgi:SpoVK/Ycf46/Vps4 family AAA+-type ATPase